MDTQRVGLCQCGIHLGTFPTEEEAARACDAAAIAHFGEFTYKNAAAGVL